MKYRYEADVEAIQFTGDNHAALRDFVSKHAGIEHVSYRQIGRDSPVDFDAPNGYRITLRNGDWAIALDGDVHAVSDQWFSRHCTPRA